MTTSLESSTTSRTLLAYQNLRNEIAASIKTGELTKTQALTKTIELMNLICIPAKYSHQKSEINSILSLSMLLED